LHERIRGATPRRSGRRRAYAPLAAFLAPGRGLARAPAEPHAAKLLAHALAAAVVLRAVAGIGLIAGSVGCGALLLLALNGAVKMLGGYARLHYRLLKPEQHTA